ncbi:MAG: methylamine dehydrogenase accessory protein MauD [Geminicoccaceae bacterium]
MDPLVVSNLVLWVVVLALALTVLALARQVGLLHERVAPVGALMLDSGPKIGEAVPPIELPLLDGPKMVLGGSASGKSRLFFFLSPSCPVCKKLLPVLRSLQGSEGRRLEILLASDGVPEQHRSFRAANDLGGFPYILSTELGVTFKIGKLPYGVVVDGQGVLRAKGLVNSREQIESLLTADELGVASIQDYVRQNA